MAWMCCLILASVLLLICAIAAALAVERLDSAEQTLYVCVAPNLSLCKAAGHFCDNAVLLWAAAQPSET